MNAGQTLSCLNSGLDTRPLLKAIESRPDLWNQITARQTTPGSPHVDTQTIFLRWSPQQTIEAVFNDLEAIDYPAIDELYEARSAINFTARKAGATKIGRAMIVSLKAGGRITAHADEGPYADHYERFHLSLKSDEGNMFYVLPRRGFAVMECVHMRPGELWWFDHKKTHFVENNSSRDRIHLIVDMVAPDYRVERVA